MNMVFCHQCMRSRPADEQVCPVCGHRHGNVQVMKHVLPPELILDGRYLLGNVQKKDSECIYYAALDLQNQGTVRIAEYFPHKKTFREGVTAVWSVPLDDVQDLLNSFQRRNSDTYLFLENGTIYSVQKTACISEVTPKNAVVKSGKKTKPKEKKKNSENKGNRNHRKSLTGIAAVVLLLLGWCGANHLRGNHAMEQADYAKAIKAYGADFLFGRKDYTEAVRMAGEECFSKEEYGAAAEYFEKLGSEGEQRWSDSVYEYAKQLIQNQKYEDAIVELEKIESEERAAEQKGVAQLEIAEELYRSGKTEEAIEQAKSIQNTTYADVTAFLNNVYLNEADLCITREDYQGAVDFYKKCQGNAEAVFHLSVFEDLLGGEPYRAASAIMEQQDTEVSGFSRGEWLRIFENVLTELPSEDNLDKYLNQEAAIALLEDAIDFYAESYFEKFNSIFGDSDMIDCDYTALGEITAVSSMEDLYSRCGINPAGKILIAVQTHDFPDKNTSQVISLDAMDLLPAEYRPSCLAEVEYVVLVDYNYNKTGSYTKGTKAVRETAKITIYHMPDKKSAATSSTLYGGRAPNSFYYYGTPPAWKSGGAPDVSEKLVELIKKIM